MSACATPIAKPPVSKPAVRALHRGPLSDLVSAAGLRWLLLVEPKAALAEPELGRAMRQIVPDIRFEAFAAASGVDLRNVPSAAIAGFPYSTLYLAEVPANVAAFARERFSERLLAGAVTKRAHPALVRVTGIVGQTPETLLTIDERAVVVSVGDPLPAKIAEAYAADRLTRSPTALRGAALSTLPDLSEHHVAVLYAPGPFADEWQRAAGGLLQVTDAVAIAMQPLPNGKVATTVYLSGAWGDSAPAAAQRLSEAWRRFAQSSAGHLFELSNTAEVEANAELLTLNVQLELAALVRGLRASVFADLSQILHLPGKMPGPAAQPSSSPTPILPPATKPTTKANIP